MRFARREAAAGLLSALLVGGPPGALRCAEVADLTSGILDSLPPGLVPSFGGFSSASSRQLGPWESWYYSGDVRDASFELRALIAQWPRTKVQAQSEDRRYLRVQFKDSDLTGPYIDDCQFYLVPTGANAGAAVVQCRRKRPLEGGASKSYASNRQRLRDLRNALGWELRASGREDNSEAFRRLEEATRKVPLAGSEPSGLSAEDWKGLRAKADAVVRLQPDGNVVIEWSQSSPWYVE